MTSKVRLQDLLVDANAFDWRAGVYIAKGAVIRLETRCLLASGDPDEEEDFDREAETRGLMRLLGMGQIQDSVSNARAQIPTVAPLRLLEALEFYLNNDAFMRLG